MLLLLIHPSYCLVLSQLQVIIIRASGEQLQTAAVLANLANIANPAQGAFVLRVVLGAIKGTRFEWRSAVDGGVTSSTDLKLGELIELNLYSIVGVALTLRFCLLGLHFTHVSTDTN
jgi:hypothetical protein